MSFRAQFARVVMISMGIVGAAARSEGQVVVTDLGTLGTASNAGGVNNSAQIVGQMSNTVAPLRATLWEQGVATDLGSFCPTCNSAALDINDSGDIVGIAFLPSFLSRGFLKQSSVMIELPPLPGHLRTIAHSINNSGDIVGQSSGATGESRPVRWLNGVPQDLGVLGFSALPMGAAFAISNAGDITGESTTTDGTLHAFLWRDGVMSDLGTAPSGSCAAKSAGTGINELGQVVGTSTVDCVTRPVTWVNGQLQILPPLDPAIVTGAASDINEAGEIIGYSGPLGNNGARAVLWRGGQVIPLGSLAGPGGFSLALDISDRGLIVGQSRTALAQSSPLHAVTFELPGAGDQLAELLSRVTAVGPGKSLQNKIRSAIASLQAGDAGGACSTLYAFLNEVAAQAGKKLTAMQAADFTAAAQRIRDVIGC